MILQIILAIGTELQAILTKMAMEITERHAVVQGIPLVQGSDKYFWFGRPQLVLHLIHFALFQVSIMLSSAFCMIISQNFVFFLQYRVLYMLFCRTHSR